MAEDSVRGVVVGRSEGSGGRAVLGEVRAVRGAQC